MNTDLLKRKIIELEKLAEEVEMQVIRFLDKAPVGDSEGKYYVRTAPSDQLKAVQRTCLRKYQVWYSSALHIVGEILPERQKNFTQYYEDIINMLFLYGRRHDNLGDFPAKFGHQVSILLSVPAVVELKKIGFRKIITSDMAQAELDHAEQLLMDGFERAAGNMAGIALELYLKTLCDTEELSYPPKPTVQTLLPILQNAQVLDIAEVKQIAYLASIRNKCSHASSDPISKGEVKTFIEEVKKLILSSGQK